MTDLIILQVRGERKLTVVDRASGKVQMMDPADLGMTADEFPRGLVGVEGAYAFGAEFDIDSRHRTQAA